MDARLLNQAPASGPDASRATLLAFARLHDSEGLPCPLSMGSCGQCCYGNDKHSIGTTMSKSIA